MRAHLAVRDLHVVHESQVDDVMRARVLHLAQALRTTSAVSCAGAVMDHSFFITPLSAKLAGPRRRAPGSAAAARSRRTRAAPPGARPEPEESRQHRRQEAEDLGRRVRPGEHAASGVGSTRCMAARAPAADAEPRDPLLILERDQSSDGPGPSPHQIHPPPAERALPVVDQVGRSTRIDTCAAPSRAAAHLFENRERAAARAERKPGS